MSKFRKPTQVEEVTAWRALAWEINLHRTLTLDQSKVVDCLKRMDAWVASHRDANGSMPDPEVNQNVWGAFWTHIAKSPEQGLKGKKKTDIE